MGNKIRQAYEQGLRIRDRVCWGNDEWIKKHSNTHSIDENGKILENNNIDFDFDKYPQDWEIFDEDLQTFNEHIDTIPETLIINGIKYKRDDN